MSHMGSVFVSFCLRAGVYKHVRACMPLTVCAMSTVNEPRVC